MDFTQDQAFKSFADSMHFIVPWCAIVGVIVTLIVVGVFDSLRGFTGVMLYVAAIFLGVLSFCFGAALSFASWGWLGLVVGVLISVVLTLTPASFYGTVIGVVVIGVAGAFWVHLSEPALLLTGMIAALGIANYVAYQRTG